MANELGGFIPYVRGLDHAHVLLPPLETLCIVEETVVREKAVESLCSIGAQMKESDVVDWFIPLVKRLSAGEWFPAGVFDLWIISHCALSLDGLEPPWVQPAPPRFFPQEGELIWLIPDTQHELLWNYSMCADTSRGTAVRELIA
ncbi:unnamed protein product [Sphagnum troendelagicum]|uniref:Uncharacterized protein n=1 Tax=Sphagnum troendelagicum TaxID=128251 RepID=A0ABP0TNQ0_9BRYO